MISILKEAILRESLLKELIVKDLKIRYSRSFLDFFWIFLSPLLSVAIFYLVFSVILKIKTEEAPFILYLMSAVFPWRFFQDSLICSTTSLVDNKNLIRESNFPSYLIPISIVLSNAIIFLPSLAILIAASLFILKGLPLSIVFIPFILVIHLAILVGLSIIFSILYVRWRDIKYILESVLLLLFYLTPVFYSISLVKDSFPSFLFKVYIYNPFVGILNLYRVVLLRGFYSSVQKEVGLLDSIVVPVCFAFLILLSGVYLYRRNKDSINDYLSY